MIRRPSPAISSAAGNSFVSSDLAKKIRLGLGELATVREQLTPLMCLPDTSAGVIERAAACAMLHSFYTEVEKILLGSVAQGTVESDVGSYGGAARGAFRRPGRSAG
jgi:hypothetical protein